MPAAAAAMRVGSMRAGSIKRVVDVVVVVDDVIVDVVVVTSCIIGILDDVLLVVVGNTTCNADADGANATTNASAPTSIYEMTNKDIIRSIIFIVVPFPRGACYYERFVSN
mmetsp:Transcript_11017/g.16667  ORF Transcript_11017/g.16667 Transcript_11017/m.16667 type:complete len:111 (-) Transcript_11017:2-334(-)